MNKLLLSCVFILLFYSTCSTGKFRVKLSHEIYAKINKEKYNAIKRPMSINRMDQRGDRVAVSTNFIDENEYAFFNLKGTDVIGIDATSREFTKNEIEIMKSEIQSLLKSNITFCSMYSTDGIEWLGHGLKYFPDTSRINYNKKLYHFLDANFAISDLNKIITDQQHRYLNSINKVKN